MEQKTATDLEKEYTTTARLKSWYASRSDTTKNALTVVGGVAAGTAAAGALVAASAIGVGTLIGGVVTGATMRYILPRINVYGNPFKNFNDDSTSVIDARTVLEARWKEAQASGVSYKDFRKQERKLVKNYAKQMRNDKLIRVFAVGAAGFGGLGVTGIRTGLSAAAADVVGDKFMYGDHLIQRAAHAVAAAMSLMFDLSPNFGTAASAAEIAQLSPKPPVIDPVVQERMAALKTPDTLIHPAEIPALERTAAEHAKWGRQLLQYYTLVMDMRDDYCKAEYARMEAAVKYLESIQKDIARGDQSAIRRLADMMEKQRIAGADPERTRALMGPIIARDTELEHFRDSLIALYQGGATLEKLTEGTVFRNGTIQTLQSVFGIRFAYDGHWRMKPVTARTLYELLNLMVSDPRVDSYSIRVTEGGNGTSNTTEHVEGSAHNVGAAFDMYPGGKLDENFVYRMLMFAYENQRIVAHDPKILAYFEAQHAAAKSTGNVRLAAHFQSRIADYHNPHFVARFDYRFEPFGTMKGIEGRLAANMAAEYGASPSESEQWIKARVGDVRNSKGKLLTTGMHFHVFALGAEPSKASWYQGFKAAEAIPLDGPRKSGTAYAEE